MEEMTEDVRLLVEDSVTRLHKQMEAFPPGFPADRNGIRLGIAAIQDETSEVLSEWYDAKRTDKDWTRVYDELLDVIAVAMYTALDIKRWKKMPSPGKFVITKTTEGQTYVSMIGVPIEELRIMRSLLFEELHRMKDDEPTSYGDKVHSAYVRVVEAITRAS